MKKVAIISCNKWKGKIKEDIFLQNNLCELGISCDILAWEENDDLNKYDICILRSVWGYQNDYSNFKKWLLEFDNHQSIIYNPINMVLDNVNKEKQFQILDKYNISHIPTNFIKELNELDNINLKNKIIKPIISGSGENTFKVSDESCKELLAILEPVMKIEDNGLMIQPYISEIENGEISCIFIDGKNTHNMLRTPGIFTEYQKPQYLSNIPNSVLNLAKSVERIQEYSGYLYMRVDIVIHSGVPIIMEVELTEPDLLIKYIADETIKQKVLTHFAKAIERKLK